MNPSPILFLDFDDVLNTPANRGEGFDVVHGFLKLNSLPDTATTQERLAMTEQLSRLAQKAFTLQAKATLKKLIQTYQMETVISSSWRVLLDRTQFEQLFKWADMEFVQLHAQWRTPLQMGQNSRLMEIQAWLNEAAVKPSAYLILDDTDSGITLKDPEHWSQIGSKTVFCDQSPDDPELIVHRGLHEDHWHLIEQILGKPSRR